MTPRDENPYQPPVEPESDPLSKAALEKKRLWRAFWFASPVFPIIAAPLVFFGGLLFHDPSSTGTPVGIVVIPMLLLSFGVVLSYVAVLIIGMPVAFSLHRSGTLNGRTLFLAALGISVFLALLLLIPGLGANGGQAAASFWQATQGFGFNLLMVATPILMTTGVFWWIGVRERR